MVINADDYYGSEAFCKMHAWLTEKHEESAIAMAGFILKNTLSENGGVMRGGCKLEEGRTHVVDVVETSDIVKTVNSGTGEVGAETDGIALNPESYVSMNMWGFPAEKGCIPDFMNVLEREFKIFFETQDKWFGVTYKEDKELVVNSFKELIAAGVYQEELYADLG